MPQIATCNFRLTKRGSEANEGLMAREYSREWPDALAVVEASIHQVREHILLSVVSVIAIHYEFCWFATRWKMVSIILIKSQTLGQSPACLFVGIRLALSLD